MHSLLGLRTEEPEDVGNTSDGTAAGASTAISTSTATPEAAGVPGSGGLIPEPAALQAQAREDGLPEPPAPLRFIAAAPKGEEVEDPEESEAFLPPGMVAVPEETWEVEQDDALSNEWYQHHGDWVTKRLVQSVMKAKGWSEKTVRAYLGQKYYTENRATLRNADDSNICQGVVHVLTNLLRRTPDEPDEAVWRRLQWRNKTNQARSQAAEEARYHGGHPSRNLPLKRYCDSDDEEEEGNKKPRAK